MSAQIEILIGFDVREFYNKFRQRWDEDRINQYLLNKNIIKPLSVDVMVWDSIFHDLEINLPEWIGPRQIWDDLERLIAFTDEKKLSLPNWQIAITELISENEKVENTITTNPSTISEQWNLIGYDIADKYLLSGLMNCGYEPKEQQKFSNLWNDRLNKYHLFHNRADAQKFCDLTAKRVPEHHPFRVYGLYLIKANFV